MYMCQVSASTNIYLNQLLIYIQKGEGYEQIRIHLLKQLNSLDSENASSDDTLVPNLIQTLRQQIISQNVQHVSRAIDIVQDLIGYANDVLGDSFCNQQFCLSLKIAINYKRLLPFGRAMQDQNKLRLASIVLYYFKLFQNDQSRYFEIFKTYKQLKQKNCVFPPQTYIKMPKVNEFKIKKQLTKRNTDKSDKSQRVGFSFQQIVQFLKQSQNQFNSNKLSCANTQFVRNLKIKAKILYDLSQNSAGLQLNAKQKQQAKHLYKRIRTLLKQIQKISQQKIKQQKIKSQKQFAQQKIQQLTPNKKKNSQVISPLTDKQTDNEMIIKLPQMVVNNQTNLLDQQVYAKGISPLKVTNKSSSLLDDQMPQIAITNTAEIRSQQKSILDVDLLDIIYQSAKKQQKHQIQQILNNKSQENINKQNLKKQQKHMIKLAKPPKYQNLLDQSYNQVAQTTTTKVESLLQSDQKQQKANFYRKSAHSIHSIHSIHSVHSITSQQSNKAINIHQNSQKGSISNSYLNKNHVEVANQHLFSRFQVINTLKDKLISNNQYNNILNDAQFSDRSSSKDKSLDQNRVNFDVNNDIFDSDQKQPYEKAFRTPKKQSSFQTKQHNSEQHQKLSMSANLNKYPTQQLIPNINFGVLADAREVTAYNYNFNTKLSESRSSINTNEQQQLKLTPENSINKQIFQTSPQTFNNNSNKNQNILLNDQDQFQEYQKGQIYSQQQIDVFQSVANQHKQQNRLKEQIHHDHQNEQLNNDQPNGQLNSNNNGVQNTDDVQTQSPSKMAVQNDQLLL